MRMSQAGCRSRTGRSGGPSPASPRRRGPG
jgi:hypothetical protein